MSRASPLKADIHRTCQHSARHGIAYKILRGLSHTRNKLRSREAAARDRTIEYDDSRVTKFVRRMGPHLDFEGRNVVDVGCGRGELAVWLAENGASSVVGIDIDSDYIGAACRHAEERGCERKVAFVCCDIHEWQPSQDIHLFTSQAAFEHVPDPKMMLEAMYRHLSPGGEVATYFGPLWLSPFGAHMYGFTPVPWVHLLFPEAVVLAVRRDVFRPDEDPSCYEEVRGGLNRITLTSFRQYALKVGFDISFWRVNPQFDRGPLRVVNSAINRVHSFAEAFSHTLSCVLKKPGA